MPNLRFLVVVRHGKGLYQERKFQALIEAERWIQGMMADCGLGRDAFATYDDSGVRTL